MKVGIQITGVKKTNLYLSEKEILINKETSIGLTKAAFYIQNEVKLSIAGHKAEPTSVDTGRFLNSIAIDIKKDEAIIYSPVSYAKYLEFGTSRIKARRHFLNTKLREKGNVVNLLKGVVNKI